ncbi:MAG TPA: glycoside hydrolase family 3 protein [Ktedonobacteraceae bacterium]
MSSLSQDLTLEEQIGQLLIVGFPGTSPTPELIELIQRHHVGNIILFSRNIRSARQLHELTSRLQELAREGGQRFPLLIAIDQENGMVQRLSKNSRMPGEAGANAPSSQADGTTASAPVREATIFPGNMTLGAIGSAEDAYEVALAAGREMHALGINLNLAPVVDVNNNPSNPVIGVRSFGEDPQEVARLACAQIRGYQQAGVATCIKHFPGHGDTATDSHLGMPVVPYALERLERLELLPFKSGIAAGSDCVMTAHISFPALMGETNLPATLSPEVIDQLLRQQLGFQGVIMTDCLEMNAVSEAVGVGRGTVLAQLAGNDLILISHRYERQLSGLEALKAALQRGEIAPERIRESAERVLALKERLRSRAESQTSAQELAWVGCEAHRQLREQIYERAVTLVRDTPGVLPLRLEPEQHLLVVYTHRDIWTQVEDQGYPEEFLVASLHQHHAHTTPIVLSEQTTPAEYEQLYHVAQTADAILMVTINALLDQRQVTVMQRLLATGRPLLGLAAYSPYDLLAFSELGTYLVTYEYTQPAIAAAIRALFGSIQPHGKLPVSLPGLYSRDLKAVDHA